MGVTTLGQFRDQVQLALGGVGTEYATIIDQWINYAYLEVTSAVDFENLEVDFAFNTVDGQRSYAGPSNVMVIRLVRNATDGYQLGWVPKEEFWRIADGTAGVPRKWTRHAGQILLHPIPNVVKNLIAVTKQNVSALSSTSDVTAIPSHWDPLVFMLACQYALMNSNQENRATAWYNRAVMYAQSRLTEANLHKLFPGLAMSQGVLTQNASIPENQVGE